MKPLICLPGWATTGDIFQGINATIIDRLDPKRFEDDLLSLNFKSATLCGFSMGGFAAYEFAKKYPELVKKLILISVRPSYPKTELDFVRSLLKRNPKAYLKEFYKSCFATQEELEKFKPPEFSLDELLAGLEYLESATVGPLPPDTICIHGTQDKIAPITEAQKLTSKLTEINTGHIPFFSKYFLNQIR